MATLLKYIKPHPVTTAERTALATLLTSLADPKHINITVLDITQNRQYRWNGTSFSLIGSNSEIDDSSTAIDKTWSSNKIDEEIGTVASNLSNEIVDRVTTDTNLLALINSEQIDRANADNDLQDQITNHTTDTSNSHNVTLEQARSAGNVLEGEINMNGNAIKNLPAAVDGGDPVRKSEYDSMLSIVVKRRGGIDLSTNPNFPDSESGDRWEVTHAGKIGGVGGIDLEIWDEIVCKEDNAGGDWAAVGDKFYFVQANVGAAAEGVSGTIMLATDAETQSGTNNTKAITALKLANWWTWIKTQAQTFAGKITFSLAPRFSTTTGGQYLKVDANKDLESVASITAADVTESGTRQFINPSGLSTQYLRGNNSWSNFTTDVLATLLAGLTATTGTPTSADSILTFAGKVLNFINNIAATVRGTVLSGFAVGTNTSITNAMSVEQAFGVTQAQINALSTGAIYWGYRVSLNQINNSIRIPFQSNLFQLSSVVVTGGVASVASYQLFKTVSATASGLGATTSMATLNSQLAALTTTEKNNGYFVEVVFSFTAGEEIGGAIITGITS